MVQHSLVRTAATRSSSAYSMVVALDNGAYDSWWLIQPVALGLPDFFLETSVLGTSSLLPVVPNSWVTSLHEPRHAEAAILSATWATSACMGDAQAVQSTDCQTTLV